MLTNGLGIFGVNITSLLFDISFLQAAGTGFFALNYFYKTTNLSRNSITKVELMDCGT